MSKFDLMLGWFQKNLDIVFFLYGMAFVIMGIVILGQLRKESRFKIINIVWALAAFGLSHGINELLDMWAIIKGRSPVFDIVRWLVLVISFVFIFEFGKNFYFQTRNKNNSNSKSKRIFSSVWVCPVLLAIVSVIAFSSSDFWKIGGIWARYLLGFPGAILAAIGFLSYYSEELKIPVGLKKYFKLAGLVFLVYGVLGGLVVPKAGFFPANWLNNDSFLALVHVPVQVFRCLCAIIISWAVVMGLKIFNWETAVELRNFLEQRGKITEGIQEGIMLIDKKFNIVWANKTLIERHGEILGQKCYLVTHKRDTPCEAPHDICPLYEAAENKKAVSVVHTHYDQNNNPRSFEVSAYPLLDDKGQVNEFVHISRDVTERQQKEEELKKAYIELERLQVELLESAKLAAVGILASGVAHEIRNPLAIILQAVNFLEDKLKPCPQNISDILMLMKNNVERSNTIINGIFDFSRKTDVAKQNEKIESIIDSSLDLVEYKFKLGNIEISKQIQPDLPFVLVNRQKIEQVLVNVLLNAFEAMPGGGRIFIRVYLKELNEIKDSVGRRRKDQFALGDQALILEIEDTGMGISKGDVEKLFTPFFTTKGPNKGVGLGLSVARNIMLNHKGSIEITSQEGVFTKVILTFKVQEKG